MRLIASLIVLLLIAANAIAQSAWPVKFSDGTIVEVIAISEKDGAKWWSPDGSKSEDPQFQSNGSISVGTKPGAKTLRLILKPGGTPLAGKNLVARVEPDFQQGLLTTRDASGQLIQVYAPVPTDKPTFRVRFGLAGGAWKDAILWQRAGGPATQPADAPLKLVGVRDDNGQTVVQLKAESPARKTDSRSVVTSGGSGGPPPGAFGGGSGGGGGGQRRGRGSMGGPPPGESIMQDLLFGASPLDQRVAVIARGQKLTPSNYQGGGDGTVTLRFACPLDQVEKVIASSRGYEWMEMQNVAAQPADVPTKVKVVPVRESASPTTAPAVKETAP